MRTLVAALALVAITPFALAAVAGTPGSSEPSGLSHAVTARERAVRVPLVGIPPGRPARLVRLHSRTLRPVSRGIRLHGWQWGIDWSPDGRHLALGVGSAAASTSSTCGAGAPAR
jgi:hypothetical protein